jgi:hypothetical protein
VLKPLLAWVVLGCVTACRFIPCTEDGSCPPGYACHIAEDLAEGECVQECVLSLQCGQGRTCTGAGRCSAELGPPDFEITDPPFNAELEAGGAADVVGVVQVGGEDVTLEIRGMDELGCTPPRPAVVLLPAQERMQGVPFAFSGVAVGEGGGTWTMTAATGTFDVEVVHVYRAGVVCGDCPSVTVAEPDGFAILGRYHAGVLLQARVVAATQPSMIFAVDPLGREWAMPLELGTVDVEGRVLPVAVGDNAVGVRVEGASAVRRCTRWVRVEPEPAALAAHLTFEGTTSDLDLAVVPTGTRLGSSSCRAGSALAGCTFPTGNRSAPGPEAALLEGLADGVWGVVVLAIPGEEGPVRATASITANGVALGTFGPRLVNPQLAEAWLVARVQVLGGVATAEPLDRVDSAAPEGLPETW